MGKRQAIQTRPLEAQMAESNDGRAQNNDNIFIVGRRGLIKTSAAVPSEPGEARVSRASIGMQGRVRTGRDQARRRLLLGVRQMRGERVRRVRSQALHQVPERLWAQ